MKPEDVRVAYERVARAYAAKFSRELEHKPLDRGLLDAFADLVRGRGRVLDLGCGPGQIAAYLGGRGVDVEGVDLSPAIVDAARALHPRIAFRVGDMLALDDADASVAGIAAFYAIVHLAPAALDGVAREWRRVLVPGGWLLMSFHVGSERLHLDEFLGETVAIDFQFHERVRVEDVLERAGLVVEARLERRGDPAIEHPSLRAYVLARRPA